MRARVAGLAGPCQVRVFVGVLAGLLAGLLAAPRTGHTQALEVRCGVEAVNAWDDAGMAVERPVTFYQAPPQGGYFALGVGADNQAGGVRSTLCLVKDLSPRGDALAPPQDYQRLWWDRGSTARRNAAVWLPNCPPGYVGLGFVVQAHYRKPTRDALRCVRRTLTVTATVAGSSATRPAAEPIYKDQGSLAFEDLSVWRAAATDGVLTGALFAWGHHAMPSAKDGLRLLSRREVRIAADPAPGK